MAVILSITLASVLAILSALSRIAASPSPNTPNWLLRSSNSIATSWLAIVVLSLAFFFIINEILQQGMAPVKYNSGGIFSLLVILLPVLLLCGGWAVGGAHPIMSALAACVLIHPVAAGLVMGMIINAIAGFVNAAHIGLFEKPDYLRTGKDIPINFRYIWWAVFLPVLFAFLPGFIEIYIGFELSLNICLPHGILELVLWALYAGSGFIAGIISLFLGGVLSSCILWPVLNTRACKIKQLKRLAKELERSGADAHIGRLFSGGDTETSLIWMWIDKFFAGVPDNASVPEEPFVDGT